MLSSLLQGLQGTGRILSSSPKSLRDGTPSLNALSSALHDLAHTTLLPPRNGRRAGLTLHQA